MNTPDKSLCQKTKEELDLALEAAIDARLAGGGGVEPLKLSDLAAGLQSHLADCPECQNYQLANRVLTEAARELPGLAADDALTDSIMMAFDKEVERESASEKSTLTYLKFAASFVAFILVGSGLSADSIWSAGAWIAALAVVALLKPLLESQAQPA